MTTPTPIRWNALTPRERNALIAEHIFGLIVYRFETAEWGTGSMVNPLRPYTTSYEASFAVVEKMREKGFEVVMDAAEVGNWVCVFFRSDDRDTIVEVEAANLPEAITIGSLQAHGFEVERE